MSVAKVIRAVVGLLVVLVIGFIVMNWWADYRSASTAASNAAATAQPSNESTTAPAVLSGIGIARIDGVNFRAKPASNAKLIRALKKGEKVTVILKDGQWYKVKDSGGKVGWVTANADYVTVQGP